MKLFAGIPSFGSVAFKKAYLAGPYLLALLIGGLPISALAEEIILTLTSSANPVPSESPVTFTAKATAVNAAAGPVTGDITFSINSFEEYQTVALDANGEATYTTSSFSYGSSATVSASFYDINYVFDMASKSLIQLGGPTASQAVITNITPASVTKGENVTVSFDVTSSESVSGLVTVTNGTESCSTMFPNEGNSCDLRLGTIGIHDITAAFVSDIQETGHSTSAVKTAEVINQAPTAEDDNYTIEEDTNALFDVLINDRDPDGSPVSLSVLGVPNQGGSISINDGAIAYQPAANFTGTESFSYTIIDSNSETVSASVTVTVSEINDEPTIDSLPETVSATAGVSYTGQILASDVDEDTLTYTATGLPAWLSLDENTGELLGTPSESDEGNSEVTFTVADREFNVSAVWSISVSIDNRAPVISSVPELNSVLAGNAYLGQVTASDADGDTLTYSASGLPAWLTLNIATGELSGTPSESDKGTSEITLSVSDSMTNTSEIWSITVTSDNVAPIITSNAITQAYAGETYIYQLTATDNNGDSLTYLSEGLPSWLTFDATSAVLSGIPSKADEGLSTVTLSVSDGVEVSSQVFDLTIIAFNEPPLITSTPATSATVASQYSYTLTATDANNDPLTLSATALPSWLTFDAETHVLAGTPSAENVGTASITLFVSDGEASATQSFSINVTPELNVDLGISLSASANPVRLGQSMTVTALATSNGNIASNVGTLEVSFVGGATISHEGECTSNQSEGITTYTCQTGTLEQSEQLSQTFTVDATTAGDIIATALLTMTNDSLTENNTDDITLTATAEIMNATEEEVGSGGAEMLAGDLNGDGEVDLLLVGGSTAAIEVYLNAGGTSWSLTSTLGGTDNTITGGELADINGDNVLDLVVIRTQGQSNRVLINNGAGVFTQSAALGNESTNDVAVADLNNDGANDLVFANTGANTVYMNNAGVFTLTDSLGSADSRGVAVGDITGDTLPDLIFANADAVSEIVNNTSLIGTAGSSATASSTTVISSPIKLVAGVSGQVQAEALTGGSNTSDYDVAVIDYDQDGDNDLIFARGVKKQITQTDSLGNPLFENDGAGNMTETKQLGNADSRSIEVFDADNDGQADIVSFNENGVHQLYRNFDSQFSVHGAVFDLPGTSGGAVADLDGNGLDDIVFVSEEEGSPVLLNRLAEDETQGDEWFGDLQVNLGIDLQATATMKVGATQTVAITLTNLEARQAEEVTLVAATEDGVQVTTATPSQGTCTVASSTTLSCLLGTLAQNESVTIQIEITADSAGEKTVAATVSASRSDSSTSDNTQEVEISVSSKKKGGGAIALWPLLILLTFRLAAYRKRHQ